MLKNPCYYGMISRLGELFQGCHESIIDKDLFDRAQAVMARKAKKKRKRKHEFLFSGLLQCGSCGAAITAEKHGDYCYYRCTKKKGACDEKYIRNSNLLEEVRKIVEEVSLPDNWTTPMLEHLDKEDNEANVEHQAAIRSLREEKIEIKQKLDKLLDLHLEGSLDKEQYVTKKNKLLNRKVEIEEKIKQSERRGDDRLEKVRELILSSQGAKKYSSDEHTQELPTFLKRAGSKFLLTGRSVQWEAARGWRVVREKRICTNWLASPVLPQPPRTILGVLRTPFIRLA
jgi:site-specific DNA recombinase